MPIKRRTKYTMCINNEDTIKYSYIALKRNSNKWFEEHTALKTKSFINYISTTTITLTVGIKINCINLIMFSYLIIIS